MPDNRLHASDYEWFVKGLDLQRNARPDRVTYGLHFAQQEVSFLAKSSMLKR